MVVRELLVAMSNAERVQPPHEPAGTVEQIELIIFAAVVRLNTGASLIVSLFLSLGLWAAIWGAVASLW
jgi:hypothetical protein